MRTQDNVQSELFSIPTDMDKKWAGMPEYVQEDLTPYRTIYMHFSCQEDVDSFQQLVGQKVSPLTKYLWYPKQKIIQVEDMRWFSKCSLNLKYPVYIISKGRWESRLTVKALDAISVPYNIVIEPQEFDQYSKVIDEDKILVLPFSNLGQGSIPARNWVWDHSIEKGYGRHWILDDNIGSFYRLNRNEKIRVGDGGIFRAAEDFSDRYENIALSGFNYEFFAKRRDVIPPTVMNTRIYSCILINNKIPYRWRGKYNEDTDLSIRVLKDGFCTVLFNAFLAKKMKTMTMAGGNTDELYKENGREKMAESLQCQHPDVVKIISRFGRTQHYVNYNIFKENKLIEKSGTSPECNGNDYGMEVRRISVG